MRNTFFFSFILLLGICGSLRSQISGAITGIIKTSDHQAAGFVSIGLKGQSAGTNSKADGSFELAALEAGNYTLVVSHVGMETIELSVDVKAGQVTTIPDIVLTESAKQLNEVIVTGTQNLNEKSLSIGKSNIRPMDLPQSISFVDKDILDRQQTQNMSDALKNFNGVYLMGTTGGVQQEIAARGFAFTSSNTFKNGVRFNNAVMPEMSALERVEVLKGSSAILFGNVSAGGVINLVTKKPTYSTGGEIGMSAGSYNLYKPSVDVYGVLSESKKAAFRLYTVYENAASFRNEVHSDRVYINPSFAFKLGKKTDLLVEGDYLRDNRTSDFGVGSINYALIDIPRNRFLGAKWSYYNTEQKSAGVTLTHRLNDSWQVKGTVSGQFFNNDLFGTTRPNASNQFIQASGNWVRGIQHTTIAESYYIAQLDLTGKFSTGAIRHNVLLGADADEYNTITTTYNGIARYDSINVFDLGKYKQRNDIPSLDRKTATGTPILRAGGYLQDLIELSKHIKLLAGVRFSYLETGSNVLNYSPYSLVKTKQYDFATTPRVGLVYQPSRKVSLFGSFANSFAPNTGVDVNGNALKPSYTNQYEAGLKSNLLKDRLSANLTVYQIVNSNLAQTSLANGNSNTNIKELAGEVTSQGFEVDLMSRSLHGFMLVGGYSYNITRYTKSNTYIEGSLLRYNPNHTANLSIFHTVNHGFLKGFNSGLSVLYFGERQAGRSTRVTVPNDPYRLFTLPAYTLVDATIGYSLKNVVLRFKLSNILNALSYNVHDDNSVNPIAPRQFATSLVIKF